MELKVQKREILGKKVKDLRKDGFVPAELYGKGVDNLHLSIAIDDFNKAYDEAGESTVVTLDIDGDKRPVLIHDAKYDELNDKWVSIDFYQVNMKEKVETSVAIEIEGEAPGVKSEGGVLVTVMDEIEVSALPGDLPHSFIVDISSLESIGDSIHVKDIKIPAGVEILADIEAVVVTIGDKQEEVQETEPVDVASVEVEGEKKEEEKKEGEESKE